jgi:type I restriction enzyme R subunit
LFVAFTATPAPATVSMFGQPFDRYTEAEAIAEGYIVDVAAGIISYKTLYHLHCPMVPTPDEERLYPKGVVSKVLQNLAFQDDGLIQYKAEVMLRVFEKEVAPLIGGRAKAMIVASSRVAGLRYFTIIKEKLKERGAGYQVLYAFSDFVHPETNAAISEHAVNGLQTGELIEDRFEGDDYRLMVVASKFQTGFDQPLLAGMFLDKPVLGRNAVQTVSRLNRCHPGKRDVVVVDFTNNAKQILTAFATYRVGTPFEPQEPDQNTCLALHAEILAAGVFTRKDVGDLLSLIEHGTDARVQFQVNALRTRFQARLADWEGRKAFVALLARFVRSFHFLTCFFTYPAAIGEFATFADYVGPQLVKAGSVSELMQQVRATVVTKAAVQFQGVTTSGGRVRLKPGKGAGGAGPVPVKVSVQDVIAQIRATYDITDEEALYIRQVTEEKIADPVIRTTVQAHRGNVIYLEGAYRGQVNGEIQSAYNAHGRYEELTDHKYTDTGGIFDIMAVTVIQAQLSLAA